MRTIGESISRVRNTFKLVKEDPFITDRFIYSMIIKYAKVLMMRQQSINQIVGFNNFFRPLPCIELIDVDKVAACCDIKSGITIKRTKERIPDMIQGVAGPLIRFVSSVDRSVQVYRTQPATYSSISKSTSFKYNTSKYYWIIDGYMYIPDIEWDSIYLEGIFDSDISAFLCGDEKACKPRQLQESQIPDFLEAEIEREIAKDLGMTMQIPSDPQADDNQNIAR